MLSIIFENKSLISPFPTLCPCHFIATASRPSQQLLPKGHLPLDVKSTMQKMVQTHRLRKTSTWHYMISLARVKKNSPYARVTFYTSLTERTTVSFTASGLRLLSVASCSSCISLTFEPGWWYCQKKDGSAQGFTPAHYLTKVTPMPQPSYSEAVSAAQGLLIFICGIVTLSSLTVLE